MKKFLNLHKLIIILLLAIGLVKMIISFGICCSSCASEIKRIENWKSEFAYPVWHQGEYFNNITIDDKLYRVFYVRDFDSSRYRFPTHIYFYIPRDDDTQPIKISYGNNYEITVMHERVPADKDFRPYPLFLFYSENEIEDIKKKPPEQLEFQIKNRLFGNENGAVALVKLDAVSREVKEVRVIFPISPLVENLKEISEDHIILPELMTKLPALPFEIIDPLPAFRETPKLLPYISKSFLGRFSRFFLIRKQPPHIKRYPVSTFIMANYFVVLFMLLLVLYIAIKTFNKFCPFKIESFAILSFTAVIFNYMILEYLIRYFRLPFLSRGGAGTGYYTLLGCYWAVILGHLALLKIKKNEYKGKVIAIIALIVGYVFIFYWAGIFIKIYFAFSQFNG